MTSVDLCSEDVVVQIATPQQIITTSEAAAVGAPVGAGATAGATAGAGGPLELGRRLLLAARAGDTQLVLDLMAKGAPFTTDWLGTSPLHLAAGNAHTATCGVLLRAGVSRDARTKVERTPLHLAAAAGHAAVCGLLLQHGARAECRDLLRMTPLHWAAERGHLAVAALLLRAGADPGARTKFGATPLALARRRGHTRVADLLLAAASEHEAQRSVRALQAERSSEEPTETQEQQPIFTTVQKLQEIILPKLKKVKTVHIITKPGNSPDKENKEEARTASPATSVSASGAGGGAGAGAALLRRHGITLLPPDTGGTVLSALQGGRTVVLSDAGKLMLKESVTAVSAPSTVTVTPGSGVTPAGVPPALGRVRGTRPLKVLGGRRLLPTQLQQVKLVQVGGATATATAGRAARGGRTPVKIIMNKTNFERLVRSATAPDDNTALLTVNDSEMSEMEPEAVETEEEAEAEAGADAATLRARLRHAERTIARLRLQLAVARGRLALYEPQ